MSYSMQLTEQIPNDPPRMGAQSTTTSNHPSTPLDPVKCCSRIYTHPFKLSETSTIWPSEHIDITLTDHFVSDEKYAIEPRTTSKLNNVSAGHVAFAEYTLSHWR